MTEERMRLTDDVLRRALVELAGDPDATALFTEVMRAVDAAPQVGRRPWQVPRIERGALLVAALIATLALGAAVALTQPRPQPKPAPTPSGDAAVTDTVREFVVPFTYTVPRGESATLGDYGGQLPPEAMAVAQRGQGRLTVFLITGSVHTCNVDPADPSVPDTLALATEPTVFLEQLRDKVGVGIGSIRPATLGNLPAVETDIDREAGTCAEARIHEDRLGLAWNTLEPTLGDPGTLVVAAVGDTTIGALISAPTDEAYEEWLPIARQYIDSFEFSPTSEE